MTQTVCILGRQPALGLAELESLYGSAVRPLGTQAALIDLEPQQIEFSRLGGTVKFCKLLAVLDTTNWGEIETYLKKTIPEHLQYLPAGKLRLGLSVYGFAVNANRINASGLELKKLIKAAGRSVRFVPNKDLALGSAQVLHNQLTQALGWEFVFVRDGNRAYLAQSIAEQDIEAYAARDQARPKRDARVGMLPPKLAQIIINLANGSAEAVDPTCGPGEPKNKTILDPFCGTGVILQEALLMGYDAYGTDLEPRMVEYSQANLEWLSAKKTNWKVEVGDATNHTWQAFDSVACETYLGRPFSALPSPQVLEEVMQDVDIIHKKFLRNLHKQTKPGFRACIAIPAWKSANGFKHLATLDHLEELGYTRTSFVHADNRDLIYHRPEQIVARELVVLTRK